MYPRRSTPGASSSRRPAGETNRQTNASRIEAGTTLRANTNARRGPTSYSSSSLTPSRTPVGRSPVRSGLDSSVVSTPVSLRRDLSPATGSRRPSARCWMCEKVCVARGWNQMPPIREHLNPNSFFGSVKGRNVGTPGKQRGNLKMSAQQDAPQGEVLTSDFTLCLQCTQAIALPPGTAIAAVIKASHSTPSSRIRTHSYVSFLREYKMLMEIVAIELGTLDTVDGIEQLIHCIQDTVLTHGEKEAQNRPGAKSLLRPEERSLLLTEAAALQLRFEALERRAKHSHFYSKDVEDTVINRYQQEREVRSDQHQSPASHNPYHYSYVGAPENQVGYESTARRPFLDDEQSSKPVHVDAQPETSMSAAAAGADPQPRGRLVKIPLRGGSQAASRSPPSRTQLRAPKEMDREFSPPSRRQQVATSPRAKSRSPYRDDHQHQQSPQQGQHASPVRHVTMDEGSIIMTERSVASQLQLAASEIQSREAEWDRQRHYYETRIHGLESDLTVAEERLLQREREVVGLKEVNASLNDKLGQTGGLARMAAHTKAVTALLVTHSNNLADAASRKVTMFSDEMLLVTEQAAKTVVYVESLERDLQASQNHLKQQQHAMESSRRAVLNAWSDAALSPSRQRRTAAAAATSAAGGSTSSVDLTSPSRNPYMKGVSPVPNMPSKTTVF